MMHLKRTVLNGCRLAIDLLYDMPAAMKAPLGLRTMTDIQSDQRLRPRDCTDVDFFRFISMIDLATFSLIWSAERTAAKLQIMTLHFSDCQCPLSNDSC